MNRSSSWFFPVPSYDVLFKSHTYKPLRTLGSLSRLQCRGDAVYSCVESMTHPGGDKVDCGMFASLLFFFPSSGFVLSISSTSVSLSCWVPFVTDISRETFGPALRERLKIKHRPQKVYILSSVFVSLRFTCPCPVSGLLTVVRGNLLTLLLLYLLGPLVCQVFWRTVLGDGGEGRREMFFYGTGCELVFFFFSFSFLSCNLALFSPFHPVSSSSDPPSSPFEKTQWCTGY